MSHVTLTVVNESGYGVTLDNVGPWSTAATNAGSSYHVSAGDRITLPADTIFNQIRASGATFVTSNTQELYTQLGLSSIVGSIKCNQQQWTGYMYSTSSGSIVWKGSCQTQQPNSIDLTVTIQTVPPPSRALGVLAIIGIVIACLVVLVLGVVILRRRRRNATPPLPYTYA